MFVCRDEQDEETGRRERERERGKSFAVAEKMSSNKRERR
jgi:hypothetical protein